MTYDHWQGRFGADPRIIGRKLRLNGYPFTVVGVARRGFRGANPTAAPHIFIPILMYGEVSGEPFKRWNNRHWWWLQTIGRAQSGANLKQA